MKVEQIIQTKGAAVHSIQESDSLTDAVGALNAKRVGALVVLDDKGKLVGILSERDIVRRLGAGGVNALNGTVSQCMTARPFTCSPDSTLDEIMHLMTDRRIRHVPVMEAGKLVGIISIGDVVKRKIEVIENEAAALREYIAS